MKWLSDNNAVIIVSRRYMGTEKDGMLDVYKLYIDVTIEERIWQWAYLIMPENIKYLQEYIKLGIAAFKKTLDV